VIFAVPSQVTNLPDYLFSDCWSLTTLTLPDSVTSVSPSAFTSDITSIIAADCPISDGLMVRLGKAFYCRGTPSSLKIPGSVREIGDRALEGRHDLKDLSFEEGILKIGVSAFHWCDHLKKAAFSASLTVIEANAFYCCNRLRQITFAVGSQLHYTRSGAFENSPLNEFVVPATIVEIDPSAFSDGAWRTCVSSEGAPLFLVRDDFVCSIDSRAIIRSFSRQTEILIGSDFEV
jgi:hypothetical protein